MTGPLTIRLAGPGDSVEVRLLDLETPAPVQTQAWITQRLEGRTLRWSPPSPASDRYGRLLAQIHVDETDDDPAWLQAELVAAGQARILSYTDPGPGLSDLLALEDEARRAGRGLWANPQFAVRSTDPDRLAQDEGFVQIVAGRVISVTRLRSGRTYLNFGADWRTDFTIMIHEDDIGDFDQAGWQADALEGQRVRVRGRIRLTNGPMIRITHPERVEILDE